jgi:hypothetical protein
MVRTFEIVLDLLEHSWEEGFGNIPIQEALAVLGEHGHIPNSVVQVQAHEPERNSRL